MRSTDEKIDVFGRTRPELDALFMRWGFSPVHSARLWRYIYLDLVDSFDAMPELPARVRARLKAEMVFEARPVVHAIDSSDGFTRKFLLALADGRVI